MQIKMEAFQKLVRDPDGAPLGKAAQRAAYAIAVSGYTAEQAAKEMKMNPSTIYRWATGDTDPYPKSLQKVAELTGFAFYWLSEGDGPMRDNAPLHHPDAAPLTISRGGDAPSEREVNRHTAYILRDEHGRTVHRVDIVTYAGEPKQGTI